MDKETQDVMFSSNRDDWETPQKFFKTLNFLYNFTLDPCSSNTNYKCKKHFTEDDNGLKKSWKGERVFVNPPYSKKGNQDEWVKKCYEESLDPNTLVVALLPARTDTKRFHQYILNKADIIWIEGRLVFELNGKAILGKNNKPQPAPFPSMLCIWNQKLMNFSVEQVEKIIKAIH